MPQGTTYNERTNDMERNRVIIKVEGAELLFIERRKPEWRSTSYHTYTVTDWRRDWREYNEEPRMYVSIQDETVLENLENRRRRPYNVFKKMIAASGIGTVLNLESLRWSQNAGCKMCPCSPGFIIPTQQISIGALNFEHFDIWVKLDGAPSVDERKAPRVIAGV